MRFVAAFLFVALLAGFVSMPMALAPASDPNAALLADLRQGGYIIYLRHAETETTPEPVVRDLADCSWQRNLSAAGRAQAAALGAVLRQQGVALAAVEASPFCRTRQTAEIALGSAPVINPDLFYHVSQTPEQVAAANAALKVMLGRRPPAGGNLLLVGHAPTMREAATVELPEGQGAIVKPGGDGTFRVVARLGMDGISAAEP
ncbi:MAG: histidine phosphatase family protein [Reyranella sp.]